MDLVYIPEVLTFGSFRSPQYRDYEQPWNRNYFDEGKTASYHHHRQQQQKQQQLHVSSNKDSCHLCKENKRRSLAAYIRGKSRNNSCSEICEETEEEDAAEQPQLDKSDSKSDKK
ncbi:uncharacterized protein LOC131671945 [Phymastichus coffea]|uniref:uncharacterized protein LOC131671945 n=1 Tax=Phymastichus coffea TaxID=108790 RepID=UPI00273AA94E|nr:uncharacterized protein LOC131671945 [Phymastichus coffea]